MKTKRIFLWSMVLALGLMLQYPQAAQIKTTTGRAFNGQIVSEDDNFMIIDVSGSKVKILKKLVLEIDGKPYKQVSAPSTDQSSETRSSTLPVDNQPSIEKTPTSTSGETSSNGSPPKTQTPSSSASDQEGQSVASTPAQKTEWQLEIHSEKYKLDVSDAEYREQCEVFPGAQGCRMDIIAGKNTYYFKPPREENLKSGFVKILLDPEKQTARIVEKECREASIEVTAQSKLIKVTILPKPSVLNVLYKTGVVDYTLVRTDEDGGGKNDTITKVLADQIFVALAEHHYNLLMKKTGFKPKKINLFFGLDDTTIIYNDFRPKNRFAMAGLSLLFPGTGQFYGDRKTPGTWYRTLGISLVSLVAIDAATMGISKLYYDNYNKQYTNESDKSKREEIDQSRAKAKNIFVATNKLLIGSSIALGVVWTFNILDPLFFSTGKKTPMQ